MLERTSPPNVVASTQKTTKAFVNTDAKCSIEPRMIVGMLFDLWKRKRTCGNWLRYFQSMATLAITIHVGITLTRCQSVELYVQTIKSK
ncbi:TPA: hypothetical protein JBD06_06840 [Legionella pneumophila subsp. pneumophila]|nr:hypothetical protein [Legionella pneumophila subsp. pneumophila]